MAKKQEFGEHIVHLEDLKPEQLLSFFKQWNSNHKRIHITEKMDGSFVRLGIDKGGFYFAMKNSLFRSAEEMPNIYYLQDLKRYFTLLKNASLESALKSGNLVEIHGEAIPSCDHNIVLYDKNKIGDGIFVIYAVKTSKKVFTDNRTLKTIATKLSTNSKVKFYANPEVSIKHFKVPNKTISSLKTLVQTRSDVLTKPARTKKTKLLKEETLKEFVETAVGFKNKLLSARYKPAFGGDIEGFVIHMPDGSMFKTIDKEKFTKTRNLNWQFMDSVKKLETEFRKKLKTNSSDLTLLLVPLEQSIKAVEDRFNKNRSVFTIPRKEKDTQEAIKHTRDIIEKIKLLIKGGVSASDIVRLYLDKRLEESTFDMNHLRSFVNEIIKEVLVGYGATGFGPLSKKASEEGEEEEKGAEKEEKPKLSTPPKVPTQPTVVSAATKLEKESLQFLQLAEGGGVFEQNNSYVPKELLAVNVKNAMKLIGLSRIDYEIVGNINKKVLGDVDIAVSKEDLVNTWGISDDKDQIWKDIDKKLTQLGTTHAIYKGLKQFHILVPLVDNNQKHVEGIDRNGKPVGQPGLIQIDVFVGNLEWMKSVLTGAPPDSAYKALYRNWLLWSIFNSIRWNDATNPELKHRLSFDRKEGLKGVTYKVIPVGGRRKKEGEEKIESNSLTTDPEKMVKFLFGPNVSWKDIDSYERLWKIGHGSFVQIQEIHTKYSI